MNFRGGNIYYEGRVDRERDPKREESIKIREVDRKEKEDRSKAYNKKEKEEEKKHREL